MFCTCTCTTTRDSALRASASRSSRKQGPTGCTIRKTRLASSWPTRMIGIRVVPEFEMPGHSRSLFAGYPELASGPGPYTVDPGGVDAVMDPTREETYKFIDKFIDEMAKLFPDDYFHIGGDEVNGHQWEANP